MLSEDRQRAEQIKMDGNVLFKKGKFAAAIDLYTEAVVLAPDMHVLFVNRALCYKKLGKWERCEQDARTALSLHSGLMKVKPSWPYRRNDPLPSAAITSAV
jgi:STIP1 homology and U-box containing protein 1